VTRSYVEYAPWVRQHAARLAAQLPFPARLVPSRNVSGLRLVIGTSAQPSFRLARMRPAAARS
jgi:hypothetical protein